MALLVTDCPRCRAQRITFELVCSSRLGGNVWEAFGVCRNCQKATNFKIATHDPPHKYGTITSSIAKNLGPVSFADHKAKPPPEHLPDNIAAAFNEGAQCLTIGCFNAAAAMFRLALDIATQALLPSGDAGPDRETRRNLHPRLAWLFQHGKLPKDLEDLASVVKNDGNDAVHRGTVDEETALDLVDFTELLLAQIYTRPERVKIAQKRSAERKTGKGGIAP